MKLLISRNLSSLGKLPEKLESLGVSLNATSLIDFEPIPFKTPSQMTWIFFGSRNAVQFYLEHSAIPSYVKVACVGSKTADFLKSKYAISADFIGKGTDPKVIGKDFSKIASGITLFPQSNISLRSIQKDLKDSEIIDLVIYKTISKAKVIEKQDQYFFTSPSNIDSYLEQNQLDLEAKYFCLGSSTQQKLTSLNVSDIQTISAISEILKFI